MKQILKCHLPKANYTVGRISKKLAYILRYGAAKEGLNIREGGWILLTELMTVPLLGRHSAYAILQEAMNSKTSRGLLRYQTRHENGQVFLRAVYGVRMERNPYHAGSQVKRLAEQCMDHVANNLNMYDLTDFPDEHAINTLIHKLRKSKRLTNKALKCLLVPTVEHLDLGACYLVESTLTRLPSLCPRLKVLNLRDCGYIMNDHLLTQLVKRLKHLEALNLSGCHHLTDSSIDTLCNHAHSLQKLNLSHVSQLSQSALLKLVTCGPPKLCHVDMTRTATVDEEARDVMRTVAQQRCMSIILEELDGVDCNPDHNGANGDLSLALASIGNSW